MNGVRIAHPKSTNFWSSTDQSREGPSPKRRKVEASTLQSPLAIHESPSKSRTGKSRVIPNSQDDVDDAEALTVNEYDEPATTRLTELEVALPAIKTDKQAIADYEASRLAGELDAPHPSIPTASSQGVPDSSPLTIQDRLSRRKWSKGKSSIYVDAFNLALETVLDEEAHLFDERENMVFEQWKGLSYEEQYLYVRLFLRKTAAWHRINRLGYYGDIADIESAIEGLFAKRSLPDVVKDENRASSPSETIQGLEDEYLPQRSLFLDSYFTFADASAEYITTLEEASTLLRLDELKVLAKDAKVQGKNKAELIQALKHSSRRQSGLAWRGRDGRASPGIAMLKRSETADSVRSDVSCASDDVDEDTGLPISRDTYYTRKVLAETGSCIRLSAGPLRLFERVHLAFYRSTEWNEKSLTTIILARISRKHFPDYIVSRSAAIFPTRDMLLEFEASLRLQFRVDSILELNGTTTQQGFEEVKHITQSVLPRWRRLVCEETIKEERIYETGEGAYLRRFNPGWVYTRIVHKGLSSLARFKEHEDEHKLLVELLDQRLFHAARRGAWYQRKALLEEHYMWQYDKNQQNISKETLKKKWRAVALKTCEDGLQDRECHLIYHYDLQKRVMKLEKALRLAKRQQHDFGHVKLAKPAERVVEGIQVLRPGDDVVTGSNADDTAAPVTRRGAKTIWLDEAEGGGECCVEAMCLSHYRSLGWKGYHSEGRIIRTLFGYIFADILFTYLPNVFQTPYQTCPLDLHTDSFYTSRASLINARLAQVANGEAENLIRQVHEEHGEKQTCIVGIDWGYELEDMLEIARCFNGQALAVVLQVMAEEYAARGGGVPDLFLWRVFDKAEDDESKTKLGNVISDDLTGNRVGKVMFAEVKSENDRLSDTQRMWIHVLSGAGVRVELCNAVAKETITRAS